MKKHILIVGCGDLGQRLASQINGQCTGLVRSEESVKRLRSMGITPLIADLDHPDNLNLPDQVNKIFYLAPPPNTGIHDPRIKAFHSALKQTNSQRRILYISTTGVYGDCRGGWINESRPVNPQVDRARRRWDAEQQLKQFCTETASEHIILRVAGIYGLDRLPLDRIKRQVPMVSEQDSPWTNRIHIDDLVTICLTAMEHAEDKEIFNVSDGHPDKMAHYFNAVADWAGLKRPPIISLDVAKKQLSPGLLSYLGESRRLSNNKIISLLTQQGLKLRYPNLESGLASEGSESSAY